MIDKTKWLVVLDKHYTESGLPVVIAAFITKKEAREWASYRHSGDRLHILRREETP